MTRHRAAGTPLLPWAALGAAAAIVVVLLGVWLSPARPLPTRPAAVLTTAPSTSPATAPTPAPLLSPSPVIHLFETHE